MGAHLRHLLYAPARSSDRSESSRSPAARPAPSPRPAFF